MQDEVALLATVTLLGVLLQGDLRAQSLPRVSAAHHRAAGVRTRLPSPVRLGGRARGGSERSRAPAGSELPAPRLRRRPHATRPHRRVNCSEYFPLFLATLWVAGIFFHEGTAALCGLVYLFARLRYFQGYARSAQQRLTPLYASARALWLLLALAALGLLVHFLPLALRTALLGRLGKLLPRA
ncbi:leukotriene C4 synthase isoform X2 [Mustela erminea]|uniref:leukotriene C4 synthase isoform X2 n=1 Tax=Mustela erminea TaxID=36723 RepID=UPI001386D36B|nr:leukotriene C4 synthase isoform X2 [Mustela erminea]